MKPLIRVFFVAAFSAITAAAQQETNPPAAEAQSPELQTEALPDEERIQFLLDVGSAYLAENDPASAITAYERILEIAPMHAEARFLSSTVYIAAKQYEKAESMLKSLMEEYPDDFQSKNNLAWLYATAEDPAFRDGQKAIELAQEAMILAPTIHNVWSTLAEAYYSTGQYGKAYRAMTHMSSLSNTRQLNISQEMAAGYMEQMRKYQRSLETEKALKPDEEEESPTTIPSVDEDAQQQES